ncbi:hypothetical protein SteCoe_12267 [Stentor coeruleus]|uniref:Phospholipase/carboxylesterase/thioesterase domain-containing protein n=1 Tax=Stentor coeruleus TaxID=5963 RepID=A0A1R2CB99_9CILI|nr:hypothetical protein SteCoe_12267 [Stentor coeruleus]
MEILRRGKDIIMNPIIHKRTLVWLHGLGDSAQGFLPIFKEHKIFEHCKIVLLTASSRPISLYKGAEMNAWYNFSSIENLEITEEIQTGAEKLAAEVSEQQKYSKEVYLGGVYLGAALSLYTGLSILNSPVRGIIGVSCYALNFNIKDSLKETPVYLYHGTADRMIPLKSAKQSFEKTLVGIPYNFTVEKDLDHGISMKTLNGISDWGKKYYID